MPVALPGLLVPDHVLRDGVGAVEVDDRRGTRRLHPPKCLRTDAKAVSGSMSPKTETIMFSGTKYRAW